MFYRLRLLPIPLDREGQRSCAALPQSHEAGVLQEGGDDNELRYVDGFKIKGDHGDKFYIILKGKVSVRVPEY